MSAAPAAAADYAMQQADFGTGLASWQTYSGGQEQSLHFAPANGLPAATYRFFVEQLLPQYTVSTLDNRGAWPQQPAPSKLLNWRTHVADFIAFAQRNYAGPIDYVGHSLGATVGLMAAIEKPALFKSLVLIDPGTMPNLAAALSMRLLPDAMKNRLGLIRSTAARRSSWPDHAAFIDYIAKRGTYRRFTQRALHDYAHGGLAPCKEGLCLRFAPAWEAHNFKTTAYVWPQLRKVKVPTLLLRGEHSNIFSNARYAKLCQRFNPGEKSFVQVAQLDGLGHLAPQEGPQATAAAVLAWLARAG